MWAWPSKRRIEGVIPQFADKAEFELHFQPFQLYPNLPAGNNDGVDKRSFWKNMGRNSTRSEDEKFARRINLKNAWAEDGLHLNYCGEEVRPDGDWGQSIDAQRMIMLAREQGREHEMIEAIYTANHTNNLPLSSWERTLLPAAEEAGVSGALEMLESDRFKAEHAAKVQSYIDMGINSVPFIIINDKYPIHGAPPKETLEAVFSQLIERGTVTLAT